MLRPLIKRLLDTLQQIGFGLESLVQRGIYLFLHEPYRYSPLPTPTHLRRCIIQPARRLRDPVVVAIDTVAFDAVGENGENGGPAAAAAADPPAYEALSYTWGSEDHPLPILIDCGEGRPGSAAARQVLFVTRNLHGALRHLRRAETPRVMWIDAICINQQDFIEKGPQVAMMDKVYQQAGRVVVWLGPAADNSDYAMSLMESWGSQVDVEFEFGTRKIHAAIGIRDLDLVDTTKPIIFSKQQGTAVTALLRRSWLTRLWIRQEISLAKANATVCCGQIELSWSVFRKAMFLLNNKPTRTKDGAPVQWDESQYFKALSQVAGLAGQARSVTLDQLRSSFGSALCKDPRDRIYAVLGMLNKIEKRGMDITADYTKTYPEVYKNAVVKYINAYKGLSILGQCGSTDDNKKTMEETEATSSWVPDWSRPPPRALQVLTLASSYIAAQYTLTDGADGSGNPIILRVAGATTTELKSVGPIVPLDEYVHLSDVARMLSDAVSALDLNHRDPALADIYARTILMGCGPGDAYPQTSSINMDECINVMRDLLSGELKSEKFPASLDPKSQAMWDCYVRLRDRRLGWDADHNPIVCPIGAQPGDQVSIILGCAYPILLRPLPPPPPQARQGAGFAVVGSCFTTDTADGAALLGPLPEGVRMTRIRAMAYRWGFVDDGTGLVSYFDSRLEVEGLGFDLQREMRSRQAMFGEMIDVDFDAMKRLIYERTGRELRWLDLL